jgi:hypothetical protein
LFVGIFTDFFQIVVGQNAARGQQFKGKGKEADNDAAAI